MGKMINFQEKICSRIIQEDEVQSCFEVEFHIHMCTSKHLQYDNPINFDGEVIRSFRNW